MLDAEKSVTAENYRHETILMDRTEQILFVLNSTEIPSKYPKLKHKLRACNSNTGTSECASELTLIGTLTSCGSKILRSTFIHQADARSPIAFPLN